MSNAFTTNYSVGGDIDRVKNLKNVEAVANVDTVTNVDGVTNVDVVAKVEEIGRIKGFPTKSTPYNFMEKFDIPALEGDYTFTVDMPSVDFEILAITLTCSGYGENDCWDMYYNDELWFDHWYTSEVKEGLFLGTSTYVFSGEANSTITLIFHNTGQQKTLYFGVRTLI